MWPCYKNEKPRSKRQEPRDKKQKSRIKKKLTSKTNIIKTKIITVVTLAFIGLSTASAQVGIGTTTPNASAILDIDATDKGFLPPRMSTADRDAISSPAEGLTIFNTNENCLQFFNGTGWFNFCDGSIELLLPLNPQTCLNGPTRVVEIISPTTNRIWMDRNLGAYRAANAPNDPYSYGDLYQLGRGTDGHQCRLSERVSNTSTTPQVSPPNTDKFLIAPSGATWYTGSSPSLANLWREDGTGENEICPLGFKLPSQAEWQAEIATWSTPDPHLDAFNALKLPHAGERSRTGSIVNGDTRNLGLYVSSTQGSGHRMLSFRNLPVSPFLGVINNNFDISGSARCIKRL